MRNYDEYSSNVYPVFLFKEFTNEYFNNYLESSSIVIRKDFYNIITINDLVKINENKIIFATTTQNKQQLY